jgi:hypothetical protein
MIRKMIGITRVSGVRTAVYVSYLLLIQCDQRRKRIYLLDRRAMHVAAVKFAQLGLWMRRRLNENLSNHERTAFQDMAESGLGIEELKLEWTDQRASQRSLRARRYCFIYIELYNVH